MGRILTTVLIVIGLAGLGLVAWVSLHDSTPAAPAPAVAAVTAPAAPPPPPAMRTVLVASAPLRAGNLIKPADLDEKALPTNTLSPDASDSNPQTRSSLFGAMIRRSLAPGEVIMPSDVMRPGDHGFLAAVLQPGMRAMTLGAGSLASDIDLVWPGDHVDLILTQQNEGGHDVAAARRVFGDTVLSDIRVLAVDQQLVEGASADQAIPKGSRTVTVEVTPDEAARLAVAARLGKLAFSIRAADRPTAEAAAAMPTPQTIWAGDVSPGLIGGTPPAPPAHTVVHVWQGSADGKEFHFD